jgi:glc operon protein GlcG
MRTIALALAEFAVLTSSATAQVALPYRPPISLAQAAKVMAAAEAEANGNHWQQAIAILDSGGHLVMLHCLDNAQHGSIVIAQRKAETVNFKRSTKVFEDMRGAGGANLRLLGSTNITPIDGGLPLIADGRIVGAIGVSAMLSAQDAQVAQAGAGVM